MGVPRAPPSRAIFLQDPFLAAFLRQPGREHKAGEDRDPRSTEPRAAWHVSGRMQGGRGAAEGGPDGQKGLLVTSLAAAVLLCGLPTEPPFAAFG